MNNKQRAEKLWNLLDDIDTVSDMFKPSETNGIQSYHNFYQYAMKKINDRFTVFKSDGFELYPTESIVENGFLLDRKDLESLVKGSFPNYNQFNNPLVKKAGHRYNDQQGITSWDSLNDLTERELLSLYLICKNGRVDKK